VALKAAAKPVGGKIAIVVSLVRRGVIVWFFFFFSVSFLASCFNLLFL
jgi:hypothetical protein